jgi:putative ABC transport system permease protein
VALVAGLSFGVAPAFRAARLDPNADPRSDGQRAAGAADRGRLRGLIVAGQTALMVVLLTGAGLLFRSLNEVMRVEPGFDPNVLTVRLSLPRKDYGQLARVSQFYRQLEARVAALPGVLSVGAVNHVPLNGALASADYKVAGGPAVSDDRLPTAQYRMATPAFFQTMGIPLVAGRAFADDDREGTALVAVVNRALARQSFPDQDPIGKHLLVKDTPDGFRSMEIVGVVGDVRHGGLETAAEPHLYVPYHQTHRELLVWLALNQFLVVRTGVEPMGLAETVRRELAAVDPNVAAADVRPSGQYVEAASAGRRFGLGLLAGFAVLALLLAVIGIYGVVSYAVAQRTREIAGMVLSEGVRRTALGLALGLLGAAAASHALRSLLYGVRPTDPWTYAAVSAVLAAVTVGACLMPARRAVRIDPLTALRTE